MGADSGVAIIGEFTLHGCKLTHYNNKYHMMGESPTEFHPLIIHWVMMKKKKETKCSEQISTYYAM